MLHILSPPDLVMSHEVMYQDVEKGETIPESKEKSILEPPSEKTMTGPSYYGRECSTSKSKSITICA